MFSEVTKLDVTILLATPESTELSQVLTLHRENTDTLGFMPQAAFEQAAAHERLLVARHNKYVVGYLLYGVNQRAELAYITHLCVSAAVRGRGVARALSQSLVQSLRETFRGIRVRCRRDYVANQIWPRLGFTYAADAPGRGRAKSILTVWWYDFGHPTLFSVLGQSEPASRAAIDTNILIDMSQSPNAPDPSSEALLADWIDLQYCVTPEVRNEIHRQEHELSRRKTMSFVSRFHLVHTQPDDVRDYSEKLRDCFPIRLTQQDESDMRHLAQCLSAAVPFFVTRDDDLISRVRDRADSLGLRVLRPWELIVHLDALRNESVYEPCRLSGSSLTIEGLVPPAHQMIELQFKLPEEKIGAFRTRLANLLSAPDLYQGFLIREGSRVLGMVVIGRPATYTLEIPLLRLRASDLRQVLARHLLEYALRIAVTEGRNAISITDGSFATMFPEAVNELGFVLLGGNLHKVALNKMIRTSELPTLFSAQSHYPVGLAKMIEDMFSRASLVQAEDWRALSRIEGTLWPLKICDALIPTYVVPIKPQWAMHLFDVGLASETLFGGESALMLRTENVYYCASRTRIDFPGRVLWYVSKGSGAYSQTMAIRAISRIDHAETGCAKDLYRKYRRLGVYRWEDVRAAAGGDPHGSITAILFSRTETFECPVDYSTLRKMWQNSIGRFFVPQTALSVPTELFEELYRMGRGRQVI